MKAVAVFPAKRDVHVIDIPEPHLSGPDRVKLRMLEVGVCGTDREITDFEYGSPPAGFDYFVLGHESLAEVAETGPAVRRVKPGDLVVSMVRRPCHDPSCAACPAGRQDFCFTDRYSERGIKDLHGFMTDFVEDEEKYLHVLPRELRDVGVLIEPLTIAEKAFIQTRLIQQRLPRGCARKAVVLGAGPVGLLGAMALVNGGFETFVYSRSRAPNAKADVAAGIGAKYISSEETGAEKMAQEVGNIDLMYEAVGASQFAFDMLKYLGPNGVFVFTGVPGHGKPVSIDTDVIMRNLVLKNQVVLGTVNASHEAFEAAIRDLAAFHARWPKAVRSLITARYPIENFREPIFDKKGIKNVIALDGHA